MDDVVEGAATKEVVHPGTCQACAHIVELIEVLLQAFLRETACDIITKAIEEGLPIDIAQLGEVEQGGDVLIKFQESDVLEGE